LTLIEMLLASALGMVLLTGVYAALAQSWRYTTLGRLEAERNQIARAVLRRIELDVRGAMFDPQAAAASTSTSTVSSGTTLSDGSTLIAGDASAETQFTGSLGIRGSSTELWIDLSHVRRDLVFPDPTVIRGGDLKTVAWFLTSPETSDTITSADAGFVRVDLDGIGLARSEGDRSMLRTLNAGSDSVLPGPTQLIAPEISSVLFRYFDGLTWYDEWDSSTVTALPRAVEVTIGFDPPGLGDGPLLTSAVSASTSSYRMVILVPVSDPTPPEDY
jgi:hypothetical protein